MNERMTASEVATFDVELAKRVEERTGHPLFPRPTKRADQKCVRCTDMRACEGGCYWVERNLCSRCAE